MIIYDSCLFIRGQTIAHLPPAANRSRTLFSTTLRSRKLDSATCLPHIRRSRARSNATRDHGWTTTCRKIIASNMCIYFKRSILYHTHDIIPWKLVIWCLFFGHIPCRVQTETQSTPILVPNLKSSLDEFSRTSSCVGHCPLPGPTCVQTWRAILQKWQLPIKYQYAC